MFYNGKNGLAIAERFNNVLGWFMRHFEDEPELESYRQNARFLGVR